MCTNVEAREKQEPNFKSFAGPIAFSYNAMKDRHACCTKNMDVASTMDSGSKSCRIFIENKRFHSRSYDL